MARAKKEISIDNCENTNEDKLTLEEKFDKIDKIVEQLEQADITLEQSFALYTEGLSLVNMCNSDIVGIEEKVKLLSDDGSTEDFE